MLSIAKYSFRYFLNAALYLVYVLLTHISGKVLFFFVIRKTFFCQYVPNTKLSNYIRENDGKVFLLLLQQEFLPYFGTIHALYIVPEEL
jgi:hypothetical protein